MKLAICNETYRDWSLRDAFEHAKSVGYHGVEIAPFTINTDARKISHVECQQVAELAKSCGLEIVGLHWLLAFTSGFHLTSPDAEVRQATADYLQTLTRICRMLGGSIMVLGSPTQRNLADGMSQATGNSLAIDCISRLIPTLVENEVTLALEPLGPEEGNFLLTAKWARELIEQIDSPNVRLHLDVKAMSTESIPIPQVIRESKQYLVHFHANDPNRRGPGMGDVSYEPIIAALREIQYSGWISVEVFDDSLLPEQLAGESVKYLKRQLT